MAWYHRDWKYRTPLTFGNHSGVTAPEGQITIPREMGKFWDNVNSDFDDVRVTAADGVTTLDWAFSGGTPSVTNKSCTIQIDETNHNVGTLYGNNAGSASVGAFLYWGNTDSNLSSGQNSSINITTTPKTVHVNLNRPGSSAGPIVRCSIPAPGQVYPDNRFGKQSGDEIAVYWDLTPVLQGLRRHSERSTRDEEIAYVTFEITDHNGVGRTGVMTPDLNSIQICEGNIVMVPIKAGTSGHRYILKLTAAVVDGAGAVRVMNFHATLVVNDLVVHTQ
tara:strand:+ start:460 stop:1290 length:831 start_codon:yes stop_codon:yes gene_type:complete